MLVEDTIRQLEASLPPSLCGEVYQKRVEIDEYKANQLAKAAAFRPTDVNSPTYALDVVLYEQAVSSVAVSVANYESSLWQNHPHLYEVHVRLMEIDRLKAELGEAGPLRTAYGMSALLPQASRKSFSSGTHPGLHHTLPSMPLPPSSTPSSTASGPSRNALNWSADMPDPKAMTDMAAPSSYPSWQSSSPYVENIRNRHFSQYLPHTHEDNRSELSDATNWTMTSMHSGSTQMSVDGRISPSVQLARSQTLDAVPESAGDQESKVSATTSWSLKTVNSSTVDMLDDAEKVMALYKSLDPQSRQELTQLLNESLKIKAAQVPPTPTLPRLTEFTSALSATEMAALSSRLEAVSTEDKPAGASMKVDALNVITKTHAHGSQLEPSGAEHARDLATPMGSDRTQNTLERQSSSSLASQGSSKTVKKKKSFGKKILSGVKTLWELPDAMWEEGQHTNVRG